MPPSNDAQFWDIRIPSTDYKKYKWRYPKMQQSQSNISITKHKETTCS